MVAIKASLLAFSAVGALAGPTFRASYEDGEALTRRYVTPSSQGTNNGFFYSMWSDGTGDVEYTNGAAGQYSLTWTNSGDVVVGKGFQTGAARNITYNADYEPNGISFLSVYGWFTDPLTEYYICESWGTGNPGQGDGMIKKGSFESDGSTYDVYEHQQVNAPSIQGTTNFMQYWSIRADKRTSGTINTANHYNYWKSVGLQIGTFNYQILATEGVKSSGQSVVTVSEGDAGADATAETASASVAAVSTASSIEPVSSTFSAPASSYSAPAPSPSVEVSSSAPAVVPVASPIPSPVASPVASYSSEVASSESSSAVVIPASTPISTAAAVSTTLSVSYANSGSSIVAPVASSAAGGFPGFGGQTPGASYRPFGGRPHLTPGATPTPYLGHHGHRGHHGHHHPNLGGSAYLPPSAVSVAAAAESSATGDDC